MQTLIRAAALLCVLASTGTAQRRSAPAAATRATVGGAILGLSPQGEFAQNVDGALGLNGHFLYRLDPQGIVAFRADINYLIYGSERYRAPLGSGPLGLVRVDVNTTNNIVHGGIGLQLLPPGSTVRPYATGSAGFSYFFTSSAVSGSDNEESFASSTNYDDGGFTWTAGGGLYVPLGHSGLNLDLGARWVDNGMRRYLRDDGITFDNDQIQLHPVRSEAQGVQFSVGVTYGIRAKK